MQPIVTVTLSLTDAHDLYRALVRQTLVDDALREEQGLEAAEPPALLGRLEQVLNVSPEQAAQHGQQAEDELWQHAWLAFTDEWAWHRAKQDVERELGKQAGTFSQDELEKATEKRYHAGFDGYLKEVELPGHEEGGSCAWPETETKVKKSSRK